MKPMIYEERNMRAIEKLGPKTKQKAKELYNYCKSEGIEILITETLRTKEQQQIYFAAGKSKTLDSYHIVGQALDWVLVDQHGEGMWEMKDYHSAKGDKVVAFAKSIGFTSGRDWGWDAPHLQYDKIAYGADKAGAKAPSKATSSGSAVVKFPGAALFMGVSGKDVERVQRALKVNVSGRFDSATDKAVRAYQKRKGLSVDGVVGLKTWNTIF